MAIQRISSLDALKGIAIIAVILYHVGYVKFGYLGVDVFLVIAGYYFSFNAYMKKQWGEKYIDLVSPVAVGKNRVKVFSDTGKIISQDCRHLTKGGAQYYAKLLRKDINMLLR